MLTGTRVLYHASSTSRYVVEFGFSLDGFVAIRIADREFVTTLSASCSKNPSSSNGKRSSKKPMCSESFSLLEFSEHSVCYDNEYIEISIESAGIV